MGGGAVAGIVIAVLVVLFVIAVALFIVMKRRNQTPEQKLKKQQDCMDKPLNGKKPEPNAV